MQNEKEKSKMTKYKFQINNKRFSFNFLGKKGFTLIEMLVAVSVFVVAVTSATAIIIATIRSQAKANIQRQTTQDARYALETITREVRMATGTNKLQAITVSGPSYISLANIPDYQDPSKYTRKIIQLKDGRITIQTIQYPGPIISPEMPITSDNIYVTEFKAENTINYNLDLGETPSRQPSVTISITTEQKDENVPVHRRAKTTLRTTISSRDYRYDK